MSKGINKVIILGNVGNAPEIKAMVGGGSFTILQVATSQSWKDRVSGEKKEFTEWHKIVLFNKLGEIASKYVTKGSKVYIEGFIQKKKYVGKDNIERQSFDIIARQMQILSKKENESDSSENYNKKTNDNSGYDQFMDDEIPF